MTKGLKLGHPPEVRVSAGFAPDADARAARKMTVTAVPLEIRMRLLLSMELSVVE
jgi:hypothetical protein